MPSNPAELLDSLVPLLDDLARDLPPGERYRRLLVACRALVPCDAIALLRLEHDTLLPAAALGLQHDVLGRRFALSAQPRLAAIVAHGGPVRFHADSELPDPYDGLIDGHQGHLPVHDCLGAPIWLDDRLWGVLTLDTLEAARFARIELGLVEHLARLAAATVKAAERMQQLQQRADFEHQLAERFRSTAHQQRPTELIGQSPAYQRLLQEIDTVAGSDLTVLIAGETGTGKEVVAHTLHDRSRRAHMPLVSVNCAALPANLVESELFGHVRGAFSGAHQDRSGKFELAHGGTLLLDEVGELPLPAQATLLRVLQTGQLQRVGSDRDIQVDVRILAATNRDLGVAVRQGSFRADLYHRLSVYPIHLPTLRDRGRDVLLLAGHFLETARARLHVRALRLSSAAQRALLAYGWPGNVRELEHLLSRAALKAIARHPAGTPRIVTLETVDLALQEGELPPPPPLPPIDCPPGATTDDAPPPGGVSLRAQVEAFQARCIQQTLRDTQGNWAACARALGLQPANLHRLARRLGIKT